MGIFDVFTSKAADKANLLQKNALMAGEAKASGLYGMGRDAVTAAYGKAEDTWGDLGQGANTAFSFANDVTGAGGAEGSARARQAFTTDPGYDFRRDESLGGVERSAAAKGMGLSGNVLLDLQTRGDALAGQAYDSWANRALQMAGMAPAIASGKSSVQTGLGDRLLGTYGQEADLAARTAAGIGKSEADAALDANRASGQFWNTLLGGLNLAGKASGFGGFAAPTRGV